MTENDLNRRNKWKGGFLKSLTFCAAIVGLFSFFTGYTSVFDIPFKWITTSKPYLVRLLIFWALAGLGALAFSISIIFLLDILMLRMKLKAALKECINLTVELFFEGVLYWVALYVLGVVLYLVFGIKYGV